MSSKILHKRSTTSGSVPTTSTLSAGEIAINVHDGKVFIRQVSSSVDRIIPLVSTHIPNSGSITGQFTGSFAGTASYALTAAYAENASADTSNFPTRTEVSGVLTSSYLSLANFNAFSSSYNTGSFTGSFVGTASYAISSSHALTASYALNGTIDTSNFPNRTEVSGAITASLVPYATLTGVSSSFTTATQVSGALNDYATLSGLSASFVDNSELTGAISNFPTRVEVSGALTASFAAFPTVSQISGALLNYALSSDVSASFVDNSELTAAISNFPTRVEITGVLGNYATTGSNIFNGNQVITGNLDILGTVTVEELHLTYITSSVLFTSGSTKFGNTNDDTHEFTGSLFITGNITADSFAGTASYALTAAYAENSTGNITIAYNNLREITTGSFDSNGTKTIELQKFLDTDIDLLTFDILTKPSGTNYYTNDLLSFYVSGNLSNKISIYLSAPAYNTNDRYKIIVVKEVGSF